MNKHIESQIQRMCKTWFDYHFPQFAPVLFAVPNGGLRSRCEAAIMKAEGVRAGVSDMILLLSRNGYTALCIEFKTDKGRQTDSQKRWQFVVEKYGCKYAIVRSFEEFTDLINEYLKNDYTDTKPVNPYRDD